MQTNIPFVLFWQKNILLWSVHFKEAKKKQLIQLAAVMLCLGSDEFSFALSQFCFLPTIHLIGCLIVTGFSINFNNDNNLILVRLHYAIVLQPI